MEDHLEYIPIAYKFLHDWSRFDCSFVLIDKISASEISRKFIKSALLVGCVCLRWAFQQWGGGKGGNLAVARIRPFLG